MKVLVAGGAGFLGRALIARLRSRGHAVAVLTRNPGAVRRSLPDVEALPWNPEGPDAFALPEGISAVVNLAGASIAHWPWTQRNKAELRRSRLDSTRRLVEAMARAPRKPEVFLSVSGLGYHGDAGERAVRPGDPPGADFLAGLAAEWENEALAAGAAGLRVVLPRLGMVLGRGDGSFPPLARAFRLGLGAVLGDGKQYWPWIHVEDAVEWMGSALEEPTTEGCFHLAAGEPLPQHAFAATLARALRRPLLFRVPAFALRTALGEMADLFLHGQKTVAEAPRFRPKYATLADALTDLLSVPRRPEPPGGS
jgi:uncharacterized protein (TIGR01777 family)